MRWSWRAFRVGAAGAVDSDAFNSSPELVLIPGHAEGGRIRVGYDPLQVDSRSARERLANNHGAENYGAGDYGRRCPEGMLGVASALPGTRALAA